MLCAPGIGCAAARSCGTPSNRSVSAGPCHIGPDTVRSIRLAIIDARVINHLLLVDVYPLIRKPTAGHVCGRRLLSLFFSMLNLKLALRTLFKTPFVTIVAIVSLALGIGANAAIFSLFNQILLRPLPVPEPDRLVNLGAPGPKPGSTSCSQAGGCDV